LALTHHSAIRKSLTTPFAGMYGCVRVELLE